jgi:hypothetical protein
MSSARGRLVNDVSRVVAVVYVRVDPRVNDVGNVGIMRSCVGCSYEPSAEVYGEMGECSLLWWPLTAALALLMRLNILI